MLGRERNCVCVTGELCLQGDLEQPPLKWEVQVRPILSSLRVSLVIGTCRVQYPTYGRKGLVRYGMVPYRTVPYGTGYWR
jgi:hypothetical protein